MSRASHLPQKPPEIIWHYTSSAALASIIQSGAFWATQTDLLKDPKEGRRALELVMDLFARIALRELPTAAREGINEFSARNRERRIQGYVTSFSGLADDAGQWEMYGDSGRGGALGFRLAAVSSPDAAVAPVYYLADGGLSDVEADNTLGPVLAHPEMWRRTLDEMQETWLPAMGPLIKDARYRAENEWRLYTTTAFLEKHPLEIKSRLRDGKATPYVEIALPSGAFVSVTTGVDFDGDIAAIRTLLDGTGCSQVQINPSSRER
jgi:hypothetical protein